MINDQDIATIIERRIPYHQHLTRLLSWLALYERMYQSMIYEGYYESVQDLRRLLRTSPVKVEQ